MGDMADYFLEQVIEEESQRDNYVSGFMCMEDAYERGYIDETGSETRGMQEAWDRAGIGDRESIDRDLMIAEADLNRASYQYHTPAAPRAQLNQAAIRNLRNDRPTCNVCRNLMQPREGRFGKFYFCSCPDQKTVSDSYWQSVRKK